MYRIPGNGFKTQLWMDNIKGNLPLENLASLSDLKLLFTQRGLINLAYISQWDEHGNWLAWFLPKVPDCLCPQKKFLLSSLIGLTPLHLHIIDKWGWVKSRVYLICQGFRVLQTSKSPLLASSLWKLVWNSFDPPKINFFNCLLMHRKILKGKNLAK